MGEYAEMMLDGTCCEGCGEFIGLDTGFPGYCSPECAADRGASEVYNYQTYGAEKPHACPECGKGFTTEKGRDQHHYDVHAARRRVPCPDCGRAVSKIGLDGHRGSPNCVARASRAAPRRKLAPFVRSAKRITDGFDLIDDGDDFS